MTRTPGLRRPGRDLRLVLPSALLLASAIPGRAAAQVVSGPDPDEGWASTGMSEVAFLSMNALLGGVTGGVVQGLRGGSFQDGFVRGALGGGIVYVGKRISVEAFPGAGLLGREVAAIGSSVVRNASEARPSLEALVFPVGPVRLYVAPGADRSFRAKLDVMDGYWLVYGLAEPRLSLDMGESLSAGAPVFRSSRWGLASRDRRVRGLALGGTVFLAPEADSWTLPHEIVHVIQHDFAHRAWTEPLDHWLAGHLPGRGLREHLEFDFSFPLLRWGAGQLLGDDLESPWESEARFLGTRRAAGEPVPTRQRPPTP